MGAGFICPVCDRHYDPPSCRCGYEEGPRGTGHLTKVTPRKRATDERPFTELVRESWSRLTPETQEAARRGIADAKEQLRRAKERKGVAA